MKFLWNRKQHEAELGVSLPLKKFTTLRAVKMPTDRFRVLQLRWMTNVEVGQIKAPKWARSRFTLAFGASQIFCYSS